MTKQEEHTISTMHDITIGHLDDVGQELSHIENLLTERRLFRKWVQDPEGADLFSEDLAKVEAELADKEGQRETLLEEYNRLERRLGWLKKQLEVLRFRADYEESDSDEESEDFVFDYSNDIPF
jgi:predicted nuclease with TOPRIM domain